MRRRAADEHLEWLSLVDVSGPFLTLPVLRRAWPTLDAVDKPTREGLAVAALGAPDEWIGWVLTGLLGWGDALSRAGLDELTTTVEQYERAVRPDLALHDPDTGAPVLLAFVLPVGNHPQARLKGDEWAATPVDRAALCCRAAGVELGLVTDGRWWTLVRAARGQVTSSATFDSATWTDAADRVVVRAFASLLHRRRFFAVPEDEQLPALFATSLDNQEEVTETLGVQVRRAVELLVDAMSREDVRLRRAGGPGLTAIPAHDVYRGAVTVMMRVVFLLFAEERGLLPGDNDVYQQAYSAGRLCQELREQASQASEEHLEQSTAAWQRLLALFAAVYSGVDHDAMPMPAYDGSLFDAANYSWLGQLRIDDRTVLHMLRSVQYVVIGREERRLSFRALDVEQIGYVYEGLLSWDGLRADTTIVGLIGKAGLEAEVHLSDLEALADKHHGVNELAAALAETYKDSKIGTARALSERLAALGKAEAADAMRLLLAVTDGERGLAERLMPFFGIIRRDLRDLPTVVLPGALYVTESTLRRTTGTHYTPRNLAEQIIDGALEPLIYNPGPLQTADRSQWKLRSSTELLRLRVADIAMGSGAFLVAACRYLAAALVQAWALEKDSRALDYLARLDEDVPVDAEADPLVIDARREIITHCLYGVDVNPMAVEMAKLSLWLVSMDPHRPFTFLDDRLLVGDSLLGVTSIEQIEYLHLDPKRGRQLHNQREMEFLTGVRELIRDAADRRRKLAQLPDATAADNVAKAAHLRAVNADTARLRLLGDLAAGAALATVKRGSGAADDASAQAVVLARNVFQGHQTAEEEAREVADQWLATDEPSGGFRRVAFHWPIEFPEVFEQGGFDATVGNPPFLGGKKIRAALGMTYRDHLVETTGRGVKGHADLVAYFVLRAHELLNLDRGQTGLIATNTLAQGDTREVALDQLLAEGSTIRRAVKSEKWPSRSAALEYCAVWISRPPVAVEVPALLDGAPVRTISASLDPVSRVSGGANRLAENAAISYVGSYVLGMGFILTAEEARLMIEKDPRNAEVLSPYLNGEDVTTRPDCSPSRWVINFFDWSIERAQRYPDVFAIVERSVRPERQRTRADGRFQLRSPLPQRYWQYADKRPGLYRAISSLERVVVITRVSKAVMPVLIPTGRVFSEATVVFASDDPAMLALLSSAPHYWWVIERCSTLETRIRYTPSDVFETFPRPEPTANLRALGDRLDAFRSGLMAARRIGLTKTYNLAHDSLCTDDDIAELRRIHVAIDEEVIRAYGWTDLLDAGLGHGFHDTRQGVRFTVAPPVRQEVLDRLLELNHERYTAEQDNLGQGRLL